MMKAIFLDRDDTVIINVPYLSNPDKINYFSCTKEALRIMLDKGYTLFLVTNQSGIGRGYFQEKDMHKVNDRIQEDMIAWGLTPFKKIAFCPHTPDDLCDCRKPQPGMINKLIDEFSIERSSSYMVGDKISDVQAGEKAGVKAALISEIAEEPDSKYKSYLNILAFAIDLP